MTPVLILISALCALAVIYPYVIYPRILRRLPTRPVTPVLGHHTSVTLLFCAYNEEASIPEKLANIEVLKARHPELEVLAFDDGSSDQTRQMLLDRPDLVQLEEGGGRNGKAHGMKRMAARATGEIIVFTDANVILREDALSNLMAWYADPQVGGVCGSLHYLDDDSSATATATVGSRYWRMEEALKAEESRTGNVMGADGSIFSLRRSLYPEFPDTVLDDLTVSMAAVFAGKRLLKVADVIAYERLVSDRSDEIARKIRIAARAYHTHLFLQPQLRQMAAQDRFKYRSRKIIRWFGGGFLTLGALAGLAATFSIHPILGGLAMLVVLGLGGLAWRQTTGIAAGVTEIVIALLATQVGVIRAMRGQVYRVWTPAKSR
ncbi:glycosyltransferase [Pseudophaeobacter sp.]|uniref:glycosyltransferase n=1 Tax=Pseudophaeobacter sp. TaxID=1971739 RepID=UPI00329910A9